jgi:hypothetical protein
MLKSKLLSISIAIIVLLLVAGLASAGLAVGGAILEKDIAPGEHLTHVIQVSTRASDLPMDIKVEVMGYGQSLDGTNIELNSSQDNGPYSAKSFLKVSLESFHLEPGEVKQVTLEGDIPSDAKSGGRYALVNIHSLRMGNGTIGVILAVDVPIRLTINGSGTLDKGEIESLRLETPVSSKHLNLSLILNNTGNHHYRPQLEAIVKDKDGNLVANASTLLGYPLLPTYPRLFKLDIKPESNLKPGKYYVDATVKTKDGSVLATKEIQFEIKS